MQSLSLTAMDWVVLVVVLASMVLSLLRGLLHEVASFGVWVLAIAASWHFSSEVAEPLSALVGAHWMGGQGAYFVAFAAILLVTWSVGRLVVKAVAALVEASGATPLDKLLGMVFGALRGLAIVLMVSLPLMMTAIPERPFWRESLVAPWIETGVRWVLPWLPERVRSMVKIAGA